MTPAFDDVFAAEAPRVWRTLRRLAPRESDADDLAQEVFLVVHRKLPTFEGRAKLSTWVYGICVKVAADHRKRAHVRHERPSDLLPDEGSEATQTDAVAHREARARLDAMLAALPDEQRELYVLCELEELTIAEAAELVGVPLQTAWSRLQAARKRIDASIVEARADLPSQRRLAVLAAHLAPLARGTSESPPAAPLPVAPAGTPASLASLPASTAGRLVLGGAAAAAAAAFVWLALPREPEPPAAPTLAAAVRAAPPAPPAEPAPTLGAEAAASAAGGAPQPARAAPAAPAPAAPAAPAPTATAADTAPTAPPAPTQDLDAELVELRAGQDLLRSDPAGALRRAEAHAARWPAGALAQEREVLAIQALVALGRTPEAEARAARFSEAWPSSAHRPRLAALLAGAEAR